MQPVWVDFKPCLYEARDLRKKLERLLGGADELLIFPWLGNDALDTIVVW